MSDPATKNGALEAMSDALLAITSEVTVERALQKMVDAARDLVDARYAALGVPDGEGGFEQFITSGISDDQIARIGPLPRTHGMLGPMLADTRPYITDNIQRDPRFEGWPRAHPDMRSFLGVPMVSKGEVIGALYLTEKRGAQNFTDEDRRLIEMLAAHAAVSIENARLYERNRELSVIEERNRLARDLHDSVTQTLFSVALTAEAAATLVDRDASAAKAQLDELKAMTQDAVKEMRSLVFELRPAELESDGLVATLRKHIDVLARVRPMEIELQVHGERRLPLDTERDVLRITQEALNNALKHADASHVSVTLDMTSGVALMVRDDGAGFDPADPRIRSKRLGLTSMQERAEALGGRLEIASSPGSGTTVRLEIAA